MTHVINSLILSSIALFSPPENWEVAAPSSPSEKIEVAFIKKKAFGFSPSINLTKEKTNLSVEKYLNVVRRIHQANPAARWKKIGVIQTCAGKADLAQIDVAAQWGDARLLQMIHISEGTAYILTAASSKEDFSDYLPLFEQTFKSFSLKEDLYQALPDSPQKEEMKLLSEKIRIAISKGYFSDAKFQKEQWKPFQKKVAEIGASLGMHWQWLMLKNGCGITDEDKVKKGTTSE